jgi:phosphoenolpyruvate---glycerone phosphotransferase subunit DhaL
VKVSTGVVTVPQLERWLRAFAALVSDQKAHLTDLDSAIGDADHGINMDRGMTAVVDKLDTTHPQAVDDLLKLVGMTLVSSVGGASGPLYGTFFLRAGGACGPEPELSPEDVAKALRAGLEGLVARGKPELGDKTMYDALHPALDALDAALARGAGVADAFADAWAACVAGRDATIPMVARKGRASYLGERSIGHQDPGATSAALLFEAATTTFSEAPR